MLQDAVTLAKIKQEKQNTFGKQRIMTVLGQAFAPLIVGVIVDYLNQGRGNDVKIVKFNIMRIIVCLKLATLNKHIL